MGAGFVGESELRRLNSSALIDPRASSLGVDQLTFCPVTRAATPGNEVTVPLPATPDRQAR